jgi:hypothetical protein
MMASQSIIKIDVGGQIFQTAISTLSKYPGSMLSAMFSHTEAGMSPMPKTERRNHHRRSLPLERNAIIGKLFWPR